ncbi:MAG: 16S rRNA (uracil(1498)-N(3))-methyltransferase [Polyangiaceae bacterium]|nr:16S rRNA (uracil(1498)-N(3))-methyltransferase [Polyangiaceae bacterium]
MLRPKVRLALPNLTPGSRVLSAQASHYLCRVHRLGNGDGFVAFDPVVHAEADACIMHCSEASAVVSVGDVRLPRVVACAPLVLVYALAKGSKVDAVVRDASELGATCIIVARTTRSVVKSDDVRAASKLERFSRIALEAARQCGRADPPSIEGIFDWDAALARAAELADSRYCLDVHATEELGPMLADDLAHHRSIAFAIGPEGGLTDREVDNARARGFVPASLGRFVLRTETVAAAVLGALRVMANVGG